MEQKTPKTRKRSSKVHKIQPKEHPTEDVQDAEEKLMSLALDKDGDGDEFVDVCQSGLMICRELHDKLFEHQKEGVAFLYNLYHKKRQGGILADDMGLGKTIQIIAFLSGMFGAGLVRSVLLIMPATLVNNWMREFANWVPGIRVKVFHGTSKKEREQNLEQIQRRTGVLLTSYQMVLANWEQLSNLDGQPFVWNYVILDEAHKIKSPSAKTTKSVYGIPAVNRILLTGTPVQNNLRELWALFDFACQGSLLGTAKTFKMEYESPIMKAREKDATLGEKALGLKISQNLMAMIKPYFLRRSKGEILKLNLERSVCLTGEERDYIALEMPSLPRKNDFIVWVYLAPMQEDIYRNFLSLDHIKELLMTTRSPLAELTVLKKLCDHPRLLSAQACANLGLEVSEYSEPTDQSTLSMTQDIKKKVSDKLLIEESGKLVFLVALLEKLQEEGHQTLVFSQSRKMLDIIEHILTKRSFRMMRVDGTVTCLAEREKRVRQFQMDKSYSVFLLTTQVGGVGLTLTSATRVVIFDPSCNPATDAQAVDRAYRIGQKENVVIYRLITCGTVEEKIYRRQVFKDSLIQQSTGDKKNPYRYFTQQELRELFTLEDTTSSATQLQLQSLHATQRNSDLELDKHIAYLHTLEMFGISDHDLMYTCETGQEEEEEEAEDDEAHQYIEHRVKKAQELVQLESQLKDKKYQKSRYSAVVQMEQKTPKTRKRSSKVHKIQPKEHPTEDVQDAEEKLMSLALDKDGDGDEFVDVCQSGLMICRELHDKLFEHQKEGVAFLYNLYHKKRQGGILADDMGLGKTIQIIAFLSGMFGAGLVRSVLLIMPATLVNNWMREFANWVPGIRVKVFHGTSKKEREQNLEQIQRRTGVLLTSYQMVLANWEQLSNLDGQPFVWNYVILDEAHKIKSPSAKTTKSVYGIPAVNRILLTGTPVQNNLRELWALFDFACQGSLLGTAKTFKMEYESPIMKAREKDATLGEKALGLKISQNLMAMIKPYFLRRSKGEILKLNLERSVCLTGEERDYIALEMPSLPRKNDFIVWVYLAPMQEDIYRNFLSLDHIKELLMTTRSPLAELTVLKKLCDHPRLLSAQACANLGLEVSEYSEPTDQSTLSMTQDIKRVSDKLLIEESGKLVFLVALLEKLQEEGHQTLVFSQSRKMLDIIEHILTKRSFRMMRVDGTVTCLAEREKRVRQFQMDKSYSVFLLTTQVGGVGLTLTSATRVVIFDPSCNPATDAQAVDRAYRIGQKENVVIYRLITCGTVEEKIYRRQVFKDSLIQQSTGDKKNPYRYFTQQELRELFTLEDTTSSATQLQLQSLHATQRNSDLELDKHIAYLHTLEMFGISDHDLMYTCETGQEEEEEEAEDDEAHQYIEHRVKKAQELVQLESQLKDKKYQKSRYS
ncbi:DNA excision repair protein ERCC-6-like isoform X2 [Anolis carolinensis]